MTVLVNFQVFAVVKLAGEQGVYRKTDLEQNVYFQRSNPPTYLGVDPVGTTRLPYSAAVADLASV